MKFRIMLRAIAIFLALAIPTKILPPLPPARKPPNLTIRALTTSLLIRGHDLTHSHGDGDVRVSLVWPRTNGSGGRS